MPIIQSVERALLILDLFDEHTTELKITDISERMQLHKSTVHSLLKTLQLHRYIDQNPENGKYRLGIKLVERGNFVINSMDIRQKAKSYLNDLSVKTGQTTHLGILDAHEGVYIDKVEGRSAIISYSRIGRRFPLHSTAVGKVLLAFKEDAEVKELLKDYEYSIQTSYTFQNEAQLMDELKTVKQQGYALDNQENELGVRCIAVPIRNYENKVIAAISISSIISRVDDAEFNHYIELMKTAGQQLSAQLGSNLPMDH